MCEQKGRATWRITAPLRLLRRVLVRLQFSAAIYPLMLGWKALRAHSRAPLRDWRDARLIARSGLIDYGWYLRSNPDVAASGVDPARHYVTYGAREGRDPNQHFATQWYLARNPDVRGHNPLAHYALHGAREGRNPSPAFDGLWYLSQNPDVLASGMNPLVHYLRYGASEGRSPAPASPCRRHLDRSFHEICGSLSFSPSNTKVAVVLHLFYEDLWEEISSYFSSIPIPFDLYISLPQEKAYRFRARLLGDYPDARVIEVPNSGRDVDAFVLTLPLILPKKYTVICKLHTKKGIAEAETLRRLMLRGLLGNAVLVSEILHAFGTRPDLLLIGPRDLYFSGPALMYENRPYLEQLISRLYPGRDLPAEWGFFAGTMFWTRPEAFTKFAEVFLERLAFESENDRYDGQFAHAAELAFGLIPTMEDATIGLATVSLDPPIARVVFVKAPGHPSPNHPLEMLRSRAEEFREAGPMPRRSPLRRWTPPVAGEPGVNLIGPVEFLNGLGTSIRGFMRALMKAGVRLNVIPWRSGFERLRAVDVRFLTDELQQINLVHLNFDLLSRLGALDKRPLVDIVNADRYNVAIVYWELASLHPEWINLLHRFDEIWCASSFMARSVAAVSSRPVRIVRPSLEISPAANRRTRAHFGLPENRFVFLYIADAGSILGRKNPQALIDAYVEEFAPDEGALCLIKLHYSNWEDREIRDILAIAKRRTDVVFTDRILDPDELTSLYELIDCYVSPHRSEGLGLTILEAMNAGKPVIATPYGGASDFVNEETAVPLEYRLVEVGKNHDPYPEHFVWADPLRLPLRSAMRRLFQNRDEAKTIGQKGQACMRDRFCLDRTSREIRAEVDRIWRGSEKGMGDRHDPEQS